MAPPDDPSTPPEAAHVLDEVADRVEANEPSDTPDATNRDSGDGDLDEARAEQAEWKKRLAEARISPRAQEALAETRAHLDAAWERSDAGTEAIHGGKLRHARRAAVAGMKPVTDHQIPFNREVVVAVDRLTRVVEELSTRLEVIDTIEPRYRDTLAAVQAGVATTSVQIDDLSGEVAELATAVSGLVGRLDAAEKAAADLRRQVGATRSREDLVLRAVRDVGPGAGAGAVLARQADGADAALLRRLGAAGRPSPEVLVSWARQLAPVIAEAASGAPVLDLDPDGGEWLDVWAELDVVGRGADGDEVRAGALVERGHDVVATDPVVHLSEAATGSLGAITAAIFADVRPLAEVVASVDHAVRVLRPGGALVLAAAHPATACTGDPIWADPRRRAVHPEALVLLALERGFAEAEAVELPTSSGEETARAYAVVARAVGGPTSG